MPCCGKIHNGEILRLVNGFAPAESRRINIFIMKRHGNLYSKITEMENLELAFILSARGKRWQHKVQKAEKKKDELLKNLQELLIKREFKTAPYRTKILYEPKRREAHVLPFYPDRITHHAVMNVVIPIWLPYFYKHVYGCIPGRGQQAASTQCMRFVHKYRYCAQLDVRHFFASINHEIMMRIIRKKIKDKDVLGWFDELIKSTGGEKGIGLGNFPSPWMGNLYLNELDQEIIKRFPNIGYERYCDDMLAFSNSKLEARQVADFIESFLLNKLKLTLSAKHVYPTSQGVDFVGYRHFPNGKILVRKSTAARMKRKIRAIPWLVKHRKLSLSQARSTLASIAGWMKWANSYNLRMKTDIDEMIKVVTEFEKLQRVC